MTDQYMKLLEEATAKCKSNVAPVQQVDEVGMVLFYTIDSWAKAHRVDPLEVVDEVLQLVKLSCDNDNN